MQNNNTTDINISKTKMKEHMESLQSLGVELIKLSNVQLKKLNLNEELQTAIIFAKTIKSNSALRRHYQFIGKLMRNIDEAELKEKLLMLNGTSKLSIKIQHDCEKWRDLLIEEDATLDEFILKYPHANITELKQLIKIVRKEMTVSKTNKQYRTLFQYIKEQIQMQF